MKCMKSVVGGILIVILSLLIFSGCTPAEQKSYQLSLNADNFNTPRQLIITNSRTDRVTLQLVGTFSIQEENNSINVICKTSDDTYEKHFYQITEWTPYFVRDLSNTGIGLYETFITYYPDKNDLL